jgi:hypothetical protein
VDPPLLWDHGRISKLTSGNGSSQALTEDRLYERIGAGWNAYSMQGGQVQREHNKRLSFTCTTETTPNQMLRATVYPLHPGLFILISGYGLDIPTPNDNTPIPSLEDVIERAYHQEVDGQSADLMPRTTEHVSIKQYGMERLLLSVTAPSRTASGPRLGFGH